MKGNNREVNTDYQKIFKDGEWWDSTGGLYRHVEIAGGSTADSEK